MQICKTKMAIAMARKGYKFTDLAAACGVSRAALSYINNGKTCKADVLLKIATALDVQPEELLKED